MSEITKKALATSLKKLVSKKELSKITVVDITKDCGVNRQTFYYHFKDINDLMEWIYTNEVIQEIEEKHKNTYQTWQQGFYYIFEYVSKNKGFVKNTYNSASRDFFLKFIYNQTDTFLLNVINEQSKNVTIKEEDKKFIADFYKYGFVGIVQEWIESGMKENPEKLVKKFNRMIEGDFENAIEKLKYNN